MLTEIHRSCVEFNTNNQADGVCQRSMRSHYTVARCVKSSLLIPTGGRLYPSTRIHSPQYNSRTLILMLPFCEGYCGRIPQRWIFAGMGCIAITNAYAMRVCLSIAITEMVEAHAVTTSNGTVSDETCPSSEATSSTSVSGGTYEWDEYTQGIILSSFFWGYIISQVPGAMLAEHFGGKYTLGIGTLCTAIFTLLIPIVVQVYGSTGLIIVRMLTGLFQGPAFPAANVLVSQWAPPDERSKICTVVVSGAALGTVLGNALTGLLIKYSPMGWPTVFYVFGVLGILWFFVWMIVCYDNPEEHPFISDEEKKYLCEAMSEHTHKQVSPTPWRHMTTSVPMWAMLVAKFGFSWGFYTVMDLPKYMSSVIKFPIEANGFLSALPYLLQLVIANASSWLADWLIANGKMSRTNVRKILFTIATMVPGIFIVAASYTGCDQTLAVIFFTIGLSSMGLMYCTMSVNPNDLSPNYAGTITAVANVFGTVAGILAPCVIGILTPNQTLLEWRLVFWITFAILCCTTLVFGIWAVAEVQFWNDPKITVKVGEQVRREGRATGGIALPKEQN